MIALTEYAGIVAGGTFQVVIGAEKNTKVRLLSNGIVIREVDGAYLGNQLLHSQFGSFFLPLNPISSLFLFFQQLLCLASDCSRWVWFWIYWTDSDFVFGQGTTIDQNQILFYRYPGAIPPVFGAIGVASGAGNTGKAFWDFDVPQGEQD